MDKKIQEETHGLLQKLQTLRGEAKVRLHLAAMDLKTELDKLEPELDKIEDEARNATEASRDALVRGLKRLEGLLHRAGEKAKKAS